MACAYAPSPTKADLAQRQNSAVLPSLSELPEPVLLRIAHFLGEEDVTRLGRTCRRLYKTLPVLLIIRGPSFSSSDWADGQIEPYFDAPALSAGVKRLTVSVARWKDQGWGYRKGELFIRLMRPVPEPEGIPRKEKKGAEEGERERGSRVSRAFKKMKDMLRFGERWPQGQTVAERSLFGLAEHHTTSPSVEMDEREAVVDRARPGDWYRFMRRVGGGGGHTLSVRGFRAVAMLKPVSYQQRTKLTH